MNTAFQPANYRDVGEALSLWIDPPPLPPGRLLRGGKLDPLVRAADLGNPRTILNLRRGPDPEHLPGMVCAHVPAANDVENYDTSHRDVRRWLTRALSVLADPTTLWPVYVHCTSGRDRTGIVIASALSLIGVPREIVVEEFLLSDGAERALIERALDGLDGARTPLAVDARSLRKALIPGAP